MLNSIIHTKSGVRLRYTSCSSFTPYWMLPSALHPSASHQQLMQTFIYIKLLTTFMP